MKLVDRLNEALKNPLDKAVAVVGMLKPVKKAKKVRQSKEDSEAEMKRYYDIVQGIWVEGAREVNKKNKKLKK
jgi:hypothetical protein